MDISRVPHFLLAHPVLILLLTGMRAYSHLHWWWGYKRQETCETQRDQSLTTARRTLPQPLAQWRTGSRN